MKVRRTAYERPRPLSPGSKRRLRAFARVAVFQPPPGPGRRPLSYTHSPAHLYIHHPLAGRAGRARPDQQSAAIGAAVPASLPGGLSSSLSSAGNASMPQRPDRQIPHHPHPERQLSRRFFLLFPFPPLFFCRRRERISGLNPDMRARPVFSRPRYGRKRCGQTVMYKYITDTVCYYHYYTCTERFVRALPRI